MRITRKPWTGDIVLGKKVNLNPEAKFTDVQGELLGITTDGNYLIVDSHQVEHQIMPHSVTVVEKGSYRKSKERGYETSKI